ncbi:MAG: TonB-dependent receptor [Gammaproteobacteria bacterium AqS3]|nr:TonB-dependent receptor [Gammaproteobacteria bacterium AqS3]
MNRQHDCGECRKILRGFGPMLGLVLCALLHSGHVAAQVDGETGENGDDIEEVIVRALPFHGSVLDSATPVYVISDEELRQMQRPSVGETLKNQPGVHSSYFGPISSSPVIRGMDAGRVMITQNNLDIGDVSRSSPDHLVASEVGVAQQIEVLRGPASLLFGSGAIGGVVNIVDNTVPRSSDRVRRWYVGRGSVADEHESGLVLGDVADSFAWGFNLFDRRTGDYSIPGYAEVKPDEGERKGTLENSKGQMRTWNLGASRLTDADGFHGASWGVMEGRYDIPAHSHGGESVYSDLRHARLQLLGGQPLDGGFFERIDYGFSSVAYDHAEIEGAAVVNRFENESQQLRLQALHREIGGWHGALIVDYIDRSKMQSGAEALTPSADVSQFAVAVLEEKHLNDDTLLLQLGARVESVDISLTGTSILCQPFAHEEHGEEEEEEEEHEEENSCEMPTRLSAVKDASFDLFSASAGLVWNVSSDLQLKFSLIHAERAPTPTELFVFGPHLATGSYDVGALYQLAYVEHEEEEEEEEEHGEEEHELEPEFSARNLDDLKSETSNSFNISLHTQRENLRLDVDLFYSQIGNFYYAGNTGEMAEAGHDEHGHEEEGGEHGDEHGEEETMPILLYRQADQVRFYGLDARLTWTLAPNIELQFYGDTVSAQRVEKENDAERLDLPRIPPTRVGARVEIAWLDGKLRTGLSNTIYASQGRIGPLETRTDGYTLTDLDLKYEMTNSNGARINLGLSVDNLADAEARVHSSFIKDKAPLPGRGFSLRLWGDM